MMFQLSPLSSLEDEDEDSFGVGVNESNVAKFGLFNSETSLDLDDFRS